MNMVDEFTTGGKYSFTIDGKPHVLTELTFADFEAFSTEEDPYKRAQMMQDLLFQNAQKRTADAIKKLSPKAVGELFRKYSGMTPGESSASPE
jgi:hypothetical protein